MLTTAACKATGPLLLCEMPGGVDLDGDSGAVGRVCKPLVQPESSAPACNMHAISDAGGDGICVDLKGGSVSIPGSLLWIQDADTVPAS